MAEQRVAAAVLDAVDEGGRDLLAALWLIGSSDMDSTVHMVDHAEFRGVLNPAMASATDGRQVQDFSMPTRMAVG
jgi:hypothetical protein